MTDMSDTALIKLREDLDGPMDHVRAIRAFVRGLRTTEQHYKAPMHCCGVLETGDAQRPATLDLQLCDGGAGEYVVMDASQWAISSEEELQVLVERVRGLLQIRTAAPGHADGLSPAHGLLPATQTKPGFFDTF